MEPDAIPITEGLRSRLEKLKARWRLATDQQVLKKALASREAGTRRAEASAEVPIDLPPEVYEAVEQLSEATKPLRGKSMRELKGAIHEQAMLGAGGWSYDFVHDRTHDGRPLKSLTLIDEYTRECLALRVERSLTSVQLLEILAELFVYRGTPDYIRSDNGPEFTANAVREWLAKVKVKTLFIQPGSPWENGYNESFING